MSSVVKEGDAITVWFSCGVASAVAAKKTLEKYSAIANVIIVNNPIEEEHPDNRRFLNDCQEWFGTEIKFAMNSKFPSCSCVDVWNHEAIMSTIHGSPCTLELKRKARFEFEKANPTDHLVLGFTSEEKRRYDRFIISERSNVLPILIEDNISRDDCFRIVREAGIKLPEVYGSGMPNANCIGCVKATSPTYWNLVREKFPDSFESRATQSRALGARLVRVKGKRIFLDELNPTDKGRMLKSYKFECGLFCEEERMS